MTTCEKHDQTMERVFDSLNNLHSKMDIVIERQEVTKKRVDKIDEALYDKDKGFFMVIGRKIASIKTHINIMWLLSFLVVGVIVRNFLIK